MAIRSPYNFVPLNQDVLIPDWCDKVSHDIPFSDGEDGIIRFTITNLTPLHISQGKASKDGKSDGITSSVLCHTCADGVKRYFIPGTSIKGMLRSVAEVLSFSKLTDYNDDYFGYRIFMNPKSEDYKLYHKEMENPLCGYLKKDGDKYVIWPCGEPEKIAIKDIKAQQKAYESEGKVLVRSGDMNSKKHEYLFPPKIGTQVDVPEEVIKVFLTVYKPNKEFEAKVRKLKHGGEIPVFYHKDKRGDVKHLGLSKNYRLPYKNNVAMAIHQKTKNLKGYATEGYDMVETLFGYAGNEKSLKGRVQVSHAFCSGTIDDDGISSVKGVLGQPQASFTPLYLKQDTQGNYASYNDSNVEIAGRKRYRIHSDQYITQIPTGNDNEKVMTQLELLPAGNSFDVAISLHNLKPEEIGLILSALTFHNTKNVHHNIGMGKSYGYGKIDVADIRLEGLGNTDIEHYLRAFEMLMCKFTLATQGIEWFKTQQVESLAAIASDHDKDLEIMTLAEYKESKQNKNYSQLKEPNVPVNGYVDRQVIEKEIEAAKKKKEAEENKRKEEELKRIKEAEDCKADAEALLKEKKFEEAKLKCNEAKELYPEIGIADLELLIERGIAASGQSSEDFVNGITIASLKAFASRCKKHVEAGNAFALSDAPLLINKIKSALPSLNKKDRGIWTDRNKWRNEKLFEYLGEEVANAILDEIVKS